MSFITVGAAALWWKLKAPYNEFLGKAHESFGEVNLHPLTYLFHMCGDVLKQAHLWK